MTASQPADWLRLGLYEWVQLGVALLMFAPAWWAAASLSLHWRRPMRLLAGFNALEGTALVLTCLVAESPRWDVQALIHAGMIAAYGLLWRGVLDLTGAFDKHRIEQWLVFLSTAVLLAVAAQSDPPLRHIKLVTHVALAWISLRAGMAVSARLRATGASRMAFAALALGWIAALPLLVQVLELAMTGASRALDEAALRDLAYLSFVVAFGINLTAAYHVFGHELRALGQVMDRAEAQSGQYRACDVEQVLAHEASVHQESGASFAVLAITLAWQVRQSSGHWQTVPVSEATMVDVQTMLRQRLAPVDVLGQAEGGIVQVCMFNIGRRQAQVRALALKSALVRLHGGRPAQHALLVTVGLVMVQPQDPPLAALKVARARCLAELERAAARIEPAGATG